ncbi:glycosyltransferase family 4 protein [Parabacteroides timonensis]|uniref:glycosyltransferase family 4 protein n=1 Tax=Parabacteroides timonensis TaxID=1871013 RepID=UPI00094F06C2|nr:glycosyltransferase family 4 protein [Parabacteroides timonensis]
MKKRKKLIRITTVPISLKTLLKEQLKFMRDYYDVIAISSDGDCFNQMLEEQGNPRSYRVEMSRKITPFKDLVSLFKLICIFVKERPDIVHTHTPKAGFLGMLAAWITRVPNRFHTVAGLPLLIATGNKRKVLNCIERLTNGCATRVYPNSFVMRDIMEKERLANPCKMKVIGNGSSNGIDTLFFSPDAVTKAKEELRKELGIADDEVAFIFVGRVVQDKGMNETCESMRELVNEGKKCKLIVVGNFENELNSLKPENEAFIRNNSSVKFLDFQTDVRSFLKAADVLILDSYREGFPNVVMQAGAMGLPCIVSDINGCNEIVVEGKNGLIVSPQQTKSLYEAMKKLIDNPDILVTMAKEARVMITSRYERKILWEALLEEYKTVE